MRIDVSGLMLRRPSGVLSLDGVSFALGEGDFCAVRGTSGAGKSSLLGVLGGHVAPTSGRVFIDSYCLSAGSLTRLRPQIGQVYQDHRLVGQASVLANIAAGYAPKLPLWRALSGRIPRHVQQRAAMLMDALGLDGALLARPVGTLSGGQAQRVGIARALIANPRLILADEPVSSLDPETARRTLKVLAAQARANGATVICTLHQPDLADAFANRTLVLDHGRTADAALTSGQAAA